jgi:ribonuclease R
LATGHIVQSMADKADTEIIIPQTILEFGLPMNFQKKSLKKLKVLKNLQNKIAKVVLIYAIYH